MARRSLQQARALVTGASSGIGAALARQLAAAEVRLLLTARRGERLAELARQLGGAVEAVVPGDITSEATRQQLLDWVASRWQGLDLLVNNAGVGASGRFCQAPPERLRTIMEVNFFAPAELTRAACPWLRRGRRPLICNISSVLGHRAVPNKAEYCASKFALHGLSDALRAELKPEGIDVLLVSPSTTESEFFRRQLAADAAEPGWKPPAWSPERVARAAVAAIRRGRHEVLLSGGGKLLVWLDRLVPTLADRLLADRTSPRNDGSPAGAR